MSHNPNVFVWLVVFKWRQYFTIYKHKKTCFVEFCATYITYNMDLFLELPEENFIQAFPSPNVYYCD